MQHHLPIRNPGAWTADALAKSPEWGHELDAAERAGLKRAMDSWRSAGIVNAVPVDGPFRGCGTAEDLPLGSLEPRLATIREQLEHGTGAVRVRDNWGAVEAGAVRGGMPERPRG